MNMRLPALLGVWIAALVCGGCGMLTGGPPAEFLRFLLSREGQQVVADGGNSSLDAATVEQGRRALGE